jgi:hypothetical protein
MSTEKSRSFWRRFWKDANGKQAVWQFPNPPIIIWLVATLLRHFVEQGPLVRLLDIVAFGAIITWAYLEIVQGDSYFRRLLGMVFLGFVAYGRLTS